VLLFALNPEVGGRLGALFERQGVQKTYVAVVRGHPLPAGEIDYFVSYLARRIAGFPADTIAAAKQAAGMGEVGLEDELAREETIFLSAASSEPARRRMAAALAMGMQTAPVERCCFDHVWGPLAGQ